MGLAAEDVVSPVRPDLLRRARVTSSARCVLLTGLASAGIIVEHGFYQPPVEVVWIAWSQLALLAAYWGMTLAERLADTPRNPFGAIGPFRVLLLALLAAGVAVEVAPGAFHGWRLVEISAVGVFILELWRLNVALSRWLASPSILFPLSFVAMILVGTVLLKAPVATPPERPISWMDALFTMTSAVCVTGLAVRDVGHEFTPLGQGIIALFMQLGGLGIIYFGSVLAMLLGRGLSLRERINLSQSLNELPLGRLSAYARFVLVATILIELAGAAAMYPLWEDPPGAALTAPQRLWLSVFHSVSAFCNAGLDLTGSSLIPYRSHGPMLAVAAVLIVLGSTGFPVLHDVASVVRWRVADRIADWRRRPRLRPDDRSLRRLSLTSRLVLVTTGVLYMVGFAAIGLAQLRPILAHPAARPELSSAQVAADCAFMSIAARTGGLASLPMSEFEPAGRFALTALMLVGGSPGSTAGGVKTTVLAVLVLSVVAAVRQRPRTEAFGRTISDAVVRRAGTLGICYLLLVAVGIFLLALTETAPMETIVFEVISATATVGLSLGLTPGLTVTGKAVVIGLMFLGRVGPLALVGALVFRTKPPAPFTYPHEQVALG